ncbi:MAG: hypothetical protein EBT92_14310 [Planctomycetes bacterium]|nr:hypothetical protein [Planctomycetota bacterium]
MKLLPQSFVKNYDKMGDNTFTQLKMVPTATLNAYIYKRTKMDGTFVSFEVFVAKQRFKGQPLPGGVVEAEDREQYPTSNNFGFTAKESRNLEQAEKFLAEFVVEMQEKKDKKDGVTKEPVDGDGFMEALTAKMNMPPKQRGRKRKERPPIVYPTGNQWLMKDLLAINKGWNQPLAYVQVQKDLEAGVVVEVARVKSPTGKGRAAVAYKAVKKV